MCAVRYSKQLINTIEYLYGRAHATPGTLQDRVKIKKGVLQGGIISATLFNLYIDDLLRELNRFFGAKPYAYADDLAVFV